MSISVMINIHTITKYFLGIPNSNKPVSISSSN